MKRSLVRVELDIFSGIHNPSWELTAEEIEELSKRLSDLQSSNEPFRGNQLGYRGFIIMYPQTMVELPERLFVCGGLLQISTEQGSIVYHDKTNIEQWLVDQAKQHGYGEIIKETMGP